MDTVAHQVIGGDLRAVSIRLLGQRRHGPPALFVYDENVLAAVPTPRDMMGTPSRDRSGYSTANSFLRVFIWALRRATIEECIWETRDSERSRVAPISFIVISS